MAQLLQVPTVNPKHPVQSLKSFGGAALGITVFALAVVAGISLKNKLQPVLARTPVVGSLFAPAASTSSAGGLFGGM